MPTGVSIPSLMDNEYVALLYTCLKHVEGKIDFEKVATELGLKDATFTKNRLQRVMKAQEKAAPSAGQGAAKDKKTNGAGGKGARPTKKRKVDSEVMVIKSEGKEDDGKDAEQLRQSLNGIDEEGEKV